MVGHKFTNEYDMILSAVSLLLDRFETEDQVFAAHCICWLTSISQLTEILIYYRHYKTFPSDYINNLEVTPLPNQVTEDVRVPESDISVPDLTIHLDNALHSSQIKIAAQALI